MSRRLVRWTCPTATHPAVLGSTRPRLDDVCRYCLGITDVDVKETLCHELAHMATPGAGHGVRWKTVFRLAAEELLGVRPRVELRYHGEVTKMLKAAAESEPKTGCSS